MECDWCGEAPATTTYTMKDNGGGWRAGAKIEVCSKCKKLLSSEGA